MRLLPMLLLLLAATGAQAAAESLQAVLDRHLRDDVAYWVDEPRLLALVRDNSTRNAGLADEEVAALDARWQGELGSAEGELTDHVLSRFASKYLAEVALRMDGAYGNLVVLDNRGLVAAASELPAHYFLGADRLLAVLAANAQAPWAQDRVAATGSFTRVALPLADPETAARIGTLILEVDAARLVKRQSLRAGSTRLAADTVSVHDDLDGVAGSN